MATESYLSAYYQRRSWSSLCCMDGADNPSVLLSDPSMFPDCKRMTEFLFHWLVMLFDNSVEHRMQGEKSEMIY